MELWYALEQKSEPSLRKEGSIIQWCTLYLHSSSDSYRKCYGKWQISQDHVEFSVLHILRNSANSVKSIVKLQDLTCP